MDKKEFINVYFTLILVYSFWCYSGVGLYKLGTRKVGCHYALLLRCGCLSVFQRANADRPLLVDSQLPRLFAVHVVISD